MRPAESLAVFQPEAQQAIHSDVIDPDECDWHQAARMKQKHEAGEHDAWFRGEVEKSLTRADSGEAQWFSHESVMAKLDARIARLKGTGA